MDTSQSNLIPSYKKTMLQTAAYKRIRSAANTVLHKFDINTTQWLMLGILNEHKAGLKITDIARSLEVEVPLITRLAQSMTQSGLVLRKASISDKRVRPVALTFRGKQVVADVEQQMQHRMSEFERVLGSSEASSYFNTLETLTKTRKPSVN